MCNIPCIHVWQVYYDHDCDKEIGDIYVKNHIQINFKNILRKEKSRIDERVKLARSLGYMRANRRIYVEAALFWRRYMGQH